MQLCTRPRTLTRPGPLDGYISEHGSWAVLQKTMNEAAAGIRVWQVREVLQRHLEVRHYAPPVLAGRAKTFESYVPLQRSPSLNRSLSFARYADGTTLPFDLGMIAHKGVPRDDARDARTVRVQGALLHKADESVPYKGINGDYDQTSKLCNGRWIYAKATLKSTVLWFSTGPAGATSQGVDSDRWCIGPEEHVGTMKGIWAFALMPGSQVPGAPAGRGPEALGKQPWNVYSYKTKKFEEQTAVEVSEVVAESDGLPARRPAAGQVKIRVRRDVGTVTRAAIGAQTQRDVTTLTTPESVLSAAHQSAASCTEEGGAGGVLGSREPPKVQRVVVLEEVQEESAGGGGEGLTSIFGQAVVRVQYAQQTLVLNVPQVRKYDRVSSVVDRVLADPTNEAFVKAAIEHESLIPCPVARTGGSVAQGALRMPLPPPISRAEHVLWDALMARFPALEDDYAVPMLRVNLEPEADGTPRYIFFSACVGQRVSV